MWCCRRSVTRRYVLCIMAWRRSSLALSQGNSIGDSLATFCKPRLTRSPENAGKVEHVIVLQFPLYSIGLLRLCEADDMGARISQSYRIHQRELRRPGLTPFARKSSLHRPNVLSIPPSMQIAPHHNLSGHDTV